MFFKVSKLCFTAILTWIVDLRRLFLNKHNIMITPIEYIEYYFEICFQSIVTVHDFLGQNTWLSLCTWLPGPWYSLFPCACLPGPVTVSVYMTSWAWIPHFVRVHDSLGQDTSLYDSTNKPRSHAVMYPCYKTLGIMPSQDSWPCRPADADKLNLTTVYVIHSNSN